MKKALLLSHCSTYFTSLIDLARMLKSTGRYEPVFHFPYSDPAPTEKEACVASGIAWIGDTRDLAERDRLAKLWRESVRGMDWVALFGAGKYSRRILDVLREQNLPMPGVIWDDNPPPDSVSGIPVTRTPDRFPDGRGIVMLGTDTFQREMRRRLASVRGKKPRIVAVCESCRPGKGSSITTRVFDEIAALRGRIASAGKILDRVRPSLIILGGDLVWYDTSAWIRAARERGIASVVAPLWMASAREPALFIRDDPEYNADLRWNRVAAAVLPKWKLDFEGRPLIRLPAHKIAAMELLGLAPPRPWTLHSGHSDAIIVESAAMKRYCEREGLSGEKIIVTGSVCHDILAAGIADREAQRGRIMQEYGFEPAKRLILCALPYNDVARYTACEFRSYSDLVAAWIAPLARMRDAVALVSVHPSADPAALHHIESPTVRLAKERAIKLMPLSDGFIACVSSTIQWAIACSLPTINYDCYRFRYTDYNGVRGVAATDNAVEYKRLVSELAGGRLAAPDAREASDWGVLDGMAGERIESAIETLVSGNFNKWRRHEQECRAAV